MVIGREGVGCLRCTGAFVTAFFATSFLAAFFAAGFLCVYVAGAFFAGIGMDMPGMSIDCAVARAETEPSASALAAPNKMIFTKLS